MKIFFGTFGAIGAKYCARQLPLPFASFRLLSFHFSSVALFVLRPPPPSPPGLPIFAPDRKKTAKMFFGAFGAGVFYAVKNHQFALQLQNFSFSGIFRKILHFFWFFKFSKFHFFTHPPKGTNFFSFFWARTFTYLYLLLWNGSFFFHIGRSGRLKGTGQLFGGGGYVYIHIYYL